jgi:hypothetical protein
MQESIDIRPLFMVAPRPGEAVALVEDLIANGVEPGEIRVFARAAPPGGLPQGVDLARVQPPARAAGRGLLAGAVAGLLAGLAVGVAAPALGSALMIGAGLGAVLGAGLAFLVSMRRRASTLGPLRRVVDRGDLVVRARVPKSRLVELEDRLKDHHPEVRVRGIDPAGSPPFP